MPNKLQGDWECMLAGLKQIKSHPWEETTIVQRLMNTSLYIKRTTDTDLRALTPIWINTDILILMPTDLAWLFVCACVREKK